VGKYFELLCDGIFSGRQLPVAGFPQKIVRAPLTLGLVNTIKLALQV
jgi:hypothetical protein